MSFQEEKIVNFLLYAKDMPLVELLHLISESGVEICLVFVNIEGLWKSYITDYSQE